MSCYISSWNRPSHELRNELKRRGKQPSGSGEKRKRSLVDRNSSGLPRLVTSTLASKERNRRQREKAGCGPRAAKKRARRSERPGNPDRGKGQQVGVFVIVRAF